MNHTLENIQQSHLPDPIVSQFFIQLFYHINAVLLNALLYRKELCTSSNGFQIKLEISELDTWILQKGGSLLQKSKYVFLNLLLFFSFFIFFLHLNN